MSTKTIVHVSIPLDLSNLIFGYENTDEHCIQYAFDITIKSMEAHVLDNMMNVLSTDIDKNVKDNMMASYLQELEILKQSAKNIKYIIERI